MEFKTTIGISNKHIHLTKETYEQLFDIPLEKYKNLKQIGEFASNNFLDIKTNHGLLKHVRIVGPFRPYNQIELSKSDTLALKIDPPVRKSGNLENSESVSLIGPMGEIFVPNCCIIAACHIHMNTREQEKYKVKENDIVTIKFEGKRKGTLSAFVRISDSGFLEAHIDRDEANAFLLNNEDEVTIIVDNEN